MFDLTKTDLFRDGDLIITVKTAHCEVRLKQYLDTLEEMGMEVHAFSNRGDHLQYLLVPDRAALQEQLHQSCRNSAGGFNVDTIPFVSGEPVV